MASQRSFRFLDDKLNLKLIFLLEDSPIRHEVDKKGFIHYSKADEKRFEDMLSILRGKVFSSWQTLFCPPETIEQYRRTMERLGVAFKEEWKNGTISFLIPGDRRPHSWRLAGE